MYCITLLYLVVFVATSAFCGCSAYLQLYPTFVYILVTTSTRQSRISLNKSANLAPLLLCKKEDNCYL